MKASRFNIIEKMGDKNIAFNGMTCALAEVDNDFMKVIDSLEKNNFDEKLVDKELLDNMKMGGYILSKDTDEIKILNYYRNKEKYKEDVLAITIAPTLECNFKCVYCYETPKKGIISDEMKSNLIEFVRSKSQGLNSFSVTWYGGEPMIARNAMYHLSDEFIKICEEKNIDYDAFIITNGSLIREEDIELFKKYNIKGAQITIDGPKEIHDKRRISKSGKSTYETILNNVNKLLENKLRVIIRINIDKTNIDTTYKLLDELKDGLVTNDVNIDFGQVSPFTEVCKSIEGTCFSNEEHSSILLPLYRRVLELGFKLNEMALYPQQRLNYCCTDYITSYVVDPDGYMYKCWNDVGIVENSFGNILSNNDYENTKEYIDWIEWNPMNISKCRECNILPICMGGCPHKVIRERKEPICDSVKHNIKDVMNFYYEIYK